MAAHVALAADVNPDPMSLIKSAISPSRAYIGTTVDALGVRLGMNLSEVKRAIKAFDAKPHVNEISLTIQHKNISVSSQRFPKSLVAAKFDGTIGTSEGITVSFSTPATGSTVVSIDRTFLFINPTTAPKVEDILKQLVIKYGPMSVSKVMQWNSTSRNGYWTFDEKALVSCPQDFCPSAANGTDKANIVLAQKALESNVHLQIEVFIAVNINDPDRASAMHIVLVDNDAIVLSHNETVKQLEAAAVANYKRRSVPQAAPRL